ncbi:DUF2332 domain-containing protein [Lichenifustis flavocetrariae]|uniref:DUF2332 family protein n=1 Tax=Lichenifustis flavocetrariae TaxID=2949735 RepID=A0AA42CIN7_9HYPH|nr:DUF2332 family protein [Lichenifustis flavocetrariae]MCW6508584.1 DUF2332 family protein [Lichenifustis flavocetrariae]
MTDARSLVLSAFAKQVEWCVRLGSPFTASLLRLLADDIATGGVTAMVVADWPGDPLSDALPLRLAGALHALVLKGLAPNLADVYPPHPTTEVRLRAAALQALRAHETFVATFLQSPPQTNEVGRAGVLVGGFLTIAANTGLPLRLLEIGASAGLNSVWDLFHYRLGGAEWGDPSSLVHLTPIWHGAIPPVSAAMGIVERRACDRAPIDIADPDQRLRLKAYVWPDQTDRLARLDGALTLALRHGIRVETADAADWVQARLAEPAIACATVLFHSIMWQYMPAPTQATIADTLARAGDGASETAPLAWLRFEPAEGTMQLRLKLWPGGEDRLLAEAQPHGSEISWLPDSKD